MQCLGNLGPFVLLAHSDTFGPRLLRASAKSWEGKKKNKAIGNSPKLHELLSLTGTSPQLFRLKPKVLGDHLPKLAVL